MNLNDDDGVLTVTVEAGGQTHTVEVDVYDAHDRFIEVAARHTGPDAGPAFRAAFQQAVADLGFPPLKVHTCCRIRDAVAARVDQLKKAAAGSGTPA